MFVGLETGQASNVHVLFQNTIQAGTPGRIFLVLGTPSTEPEAFVEGSQVQDFEVCCQGLNGKTAWAAVFLSLF